MTQLPKDTLKSKVFRDPMSSVVKDEKNISAACTKIEHYAGKAADEAWDFVLQRWQDKWENVKIFFVIFRSNYKLVVAAMIDVTDLLLKLTSSTQTLQGFLFFVAPRMDFRQSQVPDFLSDDDVLAGVWRGREAGH